MKFQRADIYGFGKWVDHSIDFSGRSAIIYGENESGKSTIQAFILFMLFGLPPKKRDFYRPKTSGKMGGRLVVSDPEVGEITIERFDEVKNGAAVCYTADGKTYDENWLKQRLRGMTSETYQSIFAFSAMDLRDLHMMNNEDIGEMLLGIGLTGSKNIHAIEKDLDKQIGELFKPYGTKPVINKQLEKLTRVKEELAKWQSKEGTYAKKKEEVSQLTNQLHDARNALKEERMKLQLIENKKQALPLFQEYVLHRKNLAGYPKTIPFPENGKERLEKQQEMLLPIRSEYDVLKENEKKYNEKISNLQKRIKDRTIYEQAKKITEEQSVYIAKKKELEQKMMHAQRKEEQLKGKLAALAIPLSIEQLSELQFPFYTENNWLQLKKEAEQLKTEKEQLEIERKTLEEEQQYLQTRLNELKKQLLPEEEVQRLREQIDLSEEEQFRIRLQEEKEQQRKKWQKIQEEEQKKRKRSAVQLSVLAFTVGLLAVFLTIDWLYPIAAAAVLFAISQWVTGSRSVPQMEEMLQAEQKTSKTLNLDREALANMKRLLEEYEALTDEMSTIEHHLKSNRMEQMKLAERKNVFAERQRRLQDTIGDNWEQYPFLKSVEVEYWPELYQRLEHVLDLWKELEQERSGIQSVQQEVRHFEKRIASLSKELTLGEETDTLSKLESFVQSFETCENDLKEYQQMAEETSEKLHQLEQQMKVYQQEIDKLLVAANVDSINGFYKQEKLHREKQETEAAIQRLEQQLNMLFKEWDWKSHISESLNEQELEWQLQETSKTMEQLEMKIEAYHEKIAQLQAEISSMELSETYPSLIQQLEMEKETLHQQAMEWAVYKTAKEMLLHTKRKYRDKYLTKVIEKTTVIFNIVTGNKYKQVYPPTEDVPFQVLSQDGIRYNASELSKGTIDQLYISLRLAINDIMSEKHQLPFMMDDAFVHFDSMRTKRMLEIVEEISKRHQVILFTCKQEVAAQAMDLETIHLDKKVQPL